MMRPSQKTGRSIYYMVNKESPFIKVFEELDNLIIDHLIGEEMYYVGSPFAKQDKNFETTRFAKQSKVTGVKTESHGRDSIYTDTALQLHTQSWLESEARCAEPAAEAG